MRYIGTALRMTIVTAILLGIIYPLAVTGLAQVIFPGKADGSLIKKDGHVIGSSLIGQQFTAAKYFQPRPSAAGAGYDAMASSASNLGRLGTSPISSAQTHQNCPDLTGIRWLGRWA